MQTANASKGVGPLGTPLDKRQVWSVLWSAAVGGGGVKAKWGIKWKVQASWWGMKKLPAFRSPTDTDLYCSEGARLANLAPVRKRSIGKEFTFGRTN